MKHPYTVVWSQWALGRLTELWLENPAIRSEITVSVNQIDAALSSSAHLIGQPAPTSARLRFVVIPPVAVLYLISDEDRQAKIVAVKLWDD